MKLRLEVTLEHVSGGTEDADYMEDITRWQLLMGKTVNGNSDGQGSDSVYKVTDVAAYDDHIED